VTTLQQPQAYHLYSVFICGFSGLIEFDGRVNKLYTTEDFTADKHILNAAIVNWQNKTIISRSKQNKIIN